MSRYPVVARRAFCSVRARELAAAGHLGASEELATLNRAFTGLLLRAVGSIAIVLIVIDMLYKPGA